MINRKTLILILIICENILVTTGTTSKSQPVGFIKGKSTYCQYKQSYSNVNGKVHVSFIPWNCESKNQVMPLTNQTLSSTIYKSDPFFEKRHKIGLIPRDFRSNFQSLLLPFNERKKTLNSEAELQLKSLEDWKANFMKTLEPFPGKPRLRLNPFAKILHGIQKREVMQSKSIPSPKETQNVNNTILPTFNSLDQSHSNRVKRSTNLKNILSARKNKYKSFLSSDTDSEPRPLTQDDYKNMFKAYYKCLEQREQDVKTGVTESISIKLIDAGQGLNIPCGICKRPDQNAESLGLSWQGIRSSDGKMIRIDFDSNVSSKKNKRIKLKDDYSLDIEMARLTDGGQYFCVVGDTYISAYQIDVLADERIRILYRNNPKDIPRPPFYINGANVKVITRWTGWSECDGCGQGTSRKKGTCTVQKINPNLPVTPEDFPMISHYKHGVPCHSSALPKFLREKPEIKNRASETIIKQCYKSCPAPAPDHFIIKDDRGRVKEFLAPGHYPIHHRPTIPPITQRKVVYEELGKHLVLKCPKTEDRRVLPIWKRLTVVINPITIRRLTKNRVYIDNARRLHIKQLYLSDATYYQCFLNTRTVATFKVVVNEPMDFRLKDYISIAGMGTTCICIVLICVCICSKSNKKTGV